MTYLEADKRTPSLTPLNKIAAYLKKDLRDVLTQCSRMTSNFESMSFVLE